MYDVIHYKQLTKTVAHIFLRGAEDSILQYDAGQYVRVLHGEQEFSFMSIANAPKANKTDLELLLAHPAKNRVAEHLLHQVQTQKQLVLQGPYGTCTAQRIIQQNPVIFLARGTGIAPIKAMIEAVVETANPPAMHLFWSATYPSDFYFQDVFVAWQKQLPNFSFTPVLTRAKKNWQGHTGLLQQAVFEHYQTLQEFYVYVSAPAAIVYDTWDALAQRGLQRTHYFSDIFDF